MWEIIRKNKQQSMLLVLLMLGLMLTLGYFCGAALFPSLSTVRLGEEDSIDWAWRFNAFGGMIGMAIATLLWAVQSVVAWRSGSKILLSISGARQIRKADHAQLFNVVEEMSIAAQLPHPPQIYVIDTPALNAFATGRSPDHAAVAISSGLLERLNRDQLQGVMAHEIAHIKNQDILFMTMMGIMVGTIVMLSDMFLRTMFYTRTGRGRTKKGNNPGHVALLVIGIVLALVSPMLAYFIYFASSRRREYLADASAAIFTRYPEGLASALELLAHDNKPMESANRATAPMYIKNPLRAKATGLSSTHPNIHERIRILRSMAGGVSFRGYQNAWAKVSEGTNPRIPRSALGEKPIAMRQPHPDAVKADRKSAQKRSLQQASDVLEKINEFILLPCACGLQVKVPQQYKKKRIRCPRCKKQLTVPLEQLAAVSAAGAFLRTQKPGDAPTENAIPVMESREALPPLEVHKAKGSGWLSVACPCGAVKNLAPSCEGDYSACSKCGRKIHIIYD